MKENAQIIEHILALFHARDERALQETAENYGSFCMSISMNILRNRQDAEECVNDTWLRAWKHIPPDKPNSLCAYLGCMVRNLSINRYHARKNRDLTVALDELIDCLPMSDGESDELPALLNQFLTIQESTDRKLFVGRYWYGRPVGRMAEVYGMTPNTASQRLSRMRKALRAFLEERGYHV